MKIQILKLFPLSAKTIFDDDLPEIKRFVGNPKPMSFTKNWYSRPTPPNMQFEERVFQTQFSISHHCPISAKKY